MNAEEILQKLQTPLANAAYKKHPSKSYLTTISAAHTRERLTETFGLYGVGWGLRWQVADCEHWTGQTANGKDRYYFFLKQAIFWFRLDPDNVVEFSVTGYSDNDNLGDAAEGAQTNAINLAAKRLLFQQHIYKDEAAPAARPAGPTKVEFLAECKTNCT